ncbi:MAG: GNAT family N-acetyltransferase [Candidatus Solibacter usitatus]|nr:GNAT family N-acetyltransferase [Candidatus Solibacter usitatus]
MEYRTDRPLSAGEYIELLSASTLGERRPVDEPQRIEQMIRHANLMVTAWEGEILVGAARCLTDFAYVTYCSDLCVRESHQRQGIGKELLRKVLEAAPCRIVLLSAPKAVDYYPRIGFTQHGSAWTIQPGELA